MASTIFQGPSGDWQLTSGKLRLARGNAIVASHKLRNRFKMQLGEWYGDIRIGIPYREVIFRKGTSLGIVKRLFTDIILSLAPTIESVDRIEAARDARTREAVVYFEARANDGRSISGGTDRPFIVGNEYIPAEGGP